ncbi:ATP-grasp domain-containing protein [Streptomyces sp. NPDC002580]|uniref:D-alanine--D-alanine ligase family protein n=1 Tax=Streptomyces sp. NPDC002580 TaxID=3364653 RepID=UPI0036BEDD67
MTTLIDPLDAAAIHREAQMLRTWQHGRPEPLDVALIYGGLSAEDRLYISDSPTKQMSVTALSEALIEIGATFKILDPCDPGFIRDLLTFDVALSNLHGPYGEDGRLQGLLDYLRMPYCGSGVAASAVAADKILCKRAMESLGVPTPVSQVWKPGVPVRWEGRPVMVKPALGGSSVGMSLVRDETELVPALERAWETDPSPVLVEEYVTGVPVTVGLLQLPGGVLVFPPLATRVHDGEFYDAASKLDAGGQGTVSVALADFPAQVLDALTGHARTLWEGLGCRGAARVDFMVTGDRTVTALEVNTTPGMSRESNFATGAALCGLSHTDVVHAFLHEALTRPPYDGPLPVPVLTASTTVRENAA